MRHSRLLNVGAQANLPVHDGCRMATALVKSEYNCFLDQLGQARQRLLIVDYDGTLAPFTSERSQAFPYAGVRELLGEISGNCNTRLVVVTGRSASDIPSLLELKVRPEIWGVYGLERLHTDGRLEIGFLPSHGLRAIAAAEAWLADFGIDDRIDLKTGAIAVHLRGLPEKQVQKIRGECHSKFAQLACAANLTLSEFDGGLELRLRGCDKEHAVNAVLAEVGDDVPMAFLGDDVSDESAFRAIRGRGLPILVRPAFRPTAAEIWLKPPEQLTEFFENWILACRGER